MTDLLIIATLLVYVCMGLRHPAVAFAGYIWTDLSVPQNISVGVALSLQFSLIMAAVCVLSLVINSGKVRKPASFAEIVLLLLFLVWMFCTTRWASNPEPAAFKLDWASKSLGFILIGFFVINSRKTFELYLATYVACVSYYALQVSLKTMAGGSGYGKSMIFGSSNNGLVESSTLGGVAAACIPIIIYLSKHSLLFSGKRSEKIGLFICVLFVVGIIGTHSRTGLVCLALLGLVAFFLTRRKLRVAMVAVVGIAAVAAFAGEDWVARMSTISSSEDDASAVGRLVVWQWTWDYAKANPLGGGFSAYLDNAGLLGDYLGDYDSVFVIPKAKAFHNIFFEILGEQGYIGVLLYFSIVVLTLKKLVAVVKGRKFLDDNHRWIEHLAVALLMGYTMMLTAGMFVGIAYRSYLFTFTLGSVFLHGHWVLAKKNIEQT